MASWASIASSTSTANKFKTKTKSTPEPAEQPLGRSILRCKYQQLPKRLRPFITINHTPTGIDICKLTKSSNNIIMLSRDLDILSSKSDLLLILDLTSDILDIIDVKLFEDTQFIFDCYRIIGLELNYKRKIPTILYRNKEFMKSLYRTTTKANDLLYLVNNKLIDEDDIKFILNSTKELKIEIQTNYNIMLINNFITEKTNRDTLKYILELVN